MRLANRFGLGLVAAAGGMSACTSVLGGFDFEGPAAGTGGSGGTMRSSTSATSTSTSTSTSTTSSSGTGGGMVCSPGTMQACYGGPAGTENVGICRPGMETCNPQGTAYGACAGEVTPKAETCGGTEDEDCDGLECVIAASGFDGYITSFAASPDGGLVVIGSVTTAPAQLGKGMLTDTGPFTAKIAADGMLAWTKPMSAMVVAVDSAGNIFTANNAQTDTVIGTTTIPVSQYVVKLDPNGNAVWARSIAGLAGNGSFSVYGGPTSIAAAPDGDVVLGGVFASTSIDLGDGPVPLLSGAPRRT